MSKNDNPQPSAPGEPTDLSCTSTTVKLRWDPPKHGYNVIDNYEVGFKEPLSKNWEKRCTNGKQEETVVSQLKSETLYMFRVRALYGDGEEGPFSPTNTNVLTKRTLGRIIITQSEQKAEGHPAIYQLPFTTNVNTTNIHAKTRKCVFGKRNPKCMDKKIIVVGPTGAGKTTLIDGMVNYVLDVNWTDDFRFSLVNLTEDEEIKKDNQTQSQTEWISCYTLNKWPTSRIDYNLTIIDTPGFGDTRGILRDKQIVDQIREFFASPAANQGIGTLDAVCFVVQAPLARLTPSQKYIFDAIMSLFGKDIASNIFVLITFADGSEPPVKTALSTAKVPFQKAYKFNNSALFSSSSISKSEEELKFSRSFWEMGQESFEIFFNELKTVKTKTLEMTTEVLRTRRQIEDVIKGLSKLNTIRQERHVLKEHRSDIENNRAFDYTVEEIHQRTVELPPKVFVTNCLTCNITCHYPCDYMDDDRKKNCSAMDSEGYCSVCSSNCIWSNHYNTPYRFEYYTVKVNKSSDELRKKFELAKEQADVHDSILEDLKSQFVQLGNRVSKMVREVKGYMNNLETIAMKPNPLWEVDYIDMLIDNERIEKKDDWEPRVNILKDMRNEAELMVKIPGENFEPWNINDYFDN